MSRAGVQVNVRLPHELKSQVEAIAADGGRSVTQEIVRALKAHSDHAAGNVRTQIRIPAATHAAVLKSSARNRRSLNAEMVHLIEYALAAVKGEQP